MDEWIESLQPMATTLVINVVIALVIFIIGRMVAGVVKNLVTKALKARGVDQTLHGFLGSLAYVSIVAFAAIAALGQLGIETTSFVAILAAGGLAIGLALSGSLANFGSGVLILIFRPFKSGDFIEAGGVTGVVENIHIFTTNLKTGDNKAVIVPNSQIMDGTITNYSSKETRRVDFVFGVSYSDDLDKVRSAILDVLSKDERILSEPATPLVVVSELADSSVNFTVRVWVKTADYWDVFFANNEAMKKRFDQDGISIPFPQQDVHLHKAD
jgi:small conductance mechanosensitive channel